VYSEQQAQPVGAFTDAMLHCLRANHMNVSIMKLYKDIHMYMQSTGFVQTPLLSCSSYTPVRNFSRVNGTLLQETSSVIVDCYTTSKQVLVSTPFVVATPVSNPVKPQKKARPFMRLQFS
jgi:hypothetical protein